VARHLQHTGQVPGDAFNYVGLRALTGAGGQRPAGGGPGGKCLTDFNGVALHRKEKLKAH